MENLINDLKNNLKEAVSVSLKDQNKLGLLFSGGLDSSLLAHLIKIQHKDLDLTLYTVGTQDSLDFKFAEEASELLDLDLKLKIIDIDSDDIGSAIPRVSHIIDSQHPVALSYELPLYLGMAEIEETCILSGQGADELFGGYSRYLKMTKSQLKSAMESDIEKLLEDDIKMDYKVAQHFKKDLQFPYLNEKVVGSAMKIPVKYKVYGGQRKIILREVAINLGLPPDLAQREKKAVQYSSGIIKTLRNMAKLKKTKVNDLIKELING